MVTQTRRPTPGVVLNMRIAPELMDQLDDRAYAMRISRAALVRRLLTAGVDAPLDDQLDGQTSLEDTA